MKKTIILKLFILFIPILLYGSKADPRPSKSINETYIIGIINKESHICLNKLLDDLRLDSYQVKLLINSNLTPWEQLKQDKLDFLIYYNSGDINLLVKETNHYKKFDVNEKNHICHTILRTINRLTKKKNKFDESDFSFDDLKSEGEKLFRLNRLSESLEFFKRAKKINSKDSDIYYFLSQIYDYQGNDKLEIENLQIAKTLNQVDGKINLGIGNYHYERREYNLAIEPYTLCLSDNDNKYPAAYNLGLIYEIQKNNDKALEFYNKIPQENYLYGRAQTRIFELTKPSIDEKVFQSQFLPFLIGAFLLIILLALFFTKYRSRFTKSIKSINPEKIPIIESSIGKGNIETAINELKTITQGSQLYHDVVHIESRWHQVKKQEMKDITGGRRIQMEKNKIVDSLLKLMK